MQFLKDWLPVWGVMFVATILLSAISDLIPSPWKGGFFGAIVVISMYMGKVVKLP